VAYLAAEAPSKHLRSSDLLKLLQLQLPRLCSNPSQSTPVVRPQRDQSADLAAAVTAALKERWLVETSALTTELNEQHSRRNELDKASDTLHVEASKLSTTVQQADRQRTDLETAEIEMQKFVQAEACRGEADPDEFLESLDPDRRQVLDCLAEELALDEMLTAFDELLAERKIAVDDFMREVRDVSRRQFMCRMMLQKAVKALDGASSGQTVPAATAITAGVSAAVIPSSAASAAPERAMVSA